MTKLPLCLALAMVVAGCAAAPASLVPTPRRAAEQAPAQAIAAPQVVVRPGAVAAPVAEWDELAPFRRIAAKGGLIAPFTEAIAQGEEAGYQVMVVPAASQAKADEKAKEWAPDARPLFAGYGFWKKSWISFVRHGYYSKAKDRALMLDFAINKAALIRKTDEEGGAYSDAANVLGDAIDQYTYGAKLATEIAKSHGYTPAKIHVGALLNLHMYGPQWVFLDDRDWSPTLLVNAKTGAVTKTGPMMEAVKLLMKPWQPSPSPSPTATPKASPTASPTATPTASPTASPTATPSAGVSPTPSPSPSSYFPF